MTSLNAASPGRSMTVAIVLIQDIFLPFLVIAPDIGFVITIQQGNAFSSVFAKK
jgi:hypothetical protein